MGKGGKGRTKQEEKGKRKGWKGKWRGGEEGHGKRSVKKGCETKRG